jgi:hypothetical protein
MAKKGTEITVVPQEALMSKFPGHFMFQLTEQEVEIMVSQNAIPSKGHLGGAPPKI